MRRLLATLVVMVSAAPAMGESPSGLSIESIFGESVQTSPSSLSWSDDGKHLAYQWTEAEDKALYALDLGTRRTRKLLELGDDEGAWKAIESVQWSPDSAQLLLDSGTDLFLLGAGGGTPRRLTEDDEPEKIARFSPDGTHIAFVRGQDLALLDLESGEVTPLTDDGEENVTLNGITDWVYWEELWSRTASGFWWSPTGDRIAFYQFDETEVPSYPMVNFLTDYPEVEWQKYPKAGETNPTVRIGVIDIATRETTWMATGEDPDVYLPRVDWAPDGRWLAIQRLNRDQNQLEILRCAAATGECAPVHSERSDTWVNVTDDLRFLKDGSFTWSSESSGWRRISLHDANGEHVRFLSPEGWHVTQIDGLDEEAGTVIYSAHPSDGLGALHRVVFRQSLAEGAPVALSPKDASSSARVAPSDGSFVLTSGSANRPSRSTVRTSDGSTLTELPGRGRPGIDPKALPETRFLSIPNPGGARLPAALTLPADFDPARKYPAIMYHYGGPASQVVADRWSWRGRALWHAWMAERGYVVLRVDNEASNFFGKDGADRAHRRFGPLNLAAQKAGVRYLASQGFVDTDRIGIWGGSGGGYHTLYALTNSPGTWKAGVAFAPVSDFKFYDTIWTERYLDHPEDNPDGYRDSATTTYAENLSDNLLIVHGTGDDNVHPQNTLVMAHALTQAGKSFEMALHPRQKHGFRGKDERHFYERMTEFFDRHLRPAAD